MASQFTTQSLANYLNEIGQQNMEDTEHTDMSEELKNQGIDMLVMAGAPAFGAIKSGIAKGQEIYSKASEFADKVSKAKTAIEEGAQKAKALAEKTTQEAQDLVEKTTGKVQEFGERTLGTAQEFGSKVGQTVSQEASNISESSFLKTAPDEARGIYTKFKSDLDSVVNEAKGQGANLVQEESQGLFDKLKAGASAIKEKAMSVKDNIVSKFTGQPVDAQGQAKTMQEQAFERDPEDFIGGATSRAPMAEVQGLTEEATRIGTGLESQARGAISNVQQAGERLAGQAQEAGEGLVGQARQLGTDTMGELLNMKSNVVSTGTDIATEGSTLARGAVEEGTNIAKGVASEGASLASGAIEEGTGIAKQAVGEGTALVSSALEEGGMVLGDVAGPVGDALEAGLLLYQTIAGIKDIIHQPQVITNPTPTFQAGI